MICERARTAYRFNEEDMKVWTEDDRLLGNYLARTTKGPGVKERIEDFIEKDFRFTGDFVVTPTYIFFEFEEDAILFQLTFLDY